MRTYFYLWNAQRDSEYVRLFNSCPGLGQNNAFPSYDVDNTIKIFVTYQSMSFYGKNEYMEPIGMTNMVFFNW